MILELVLFKNPGGLAIAAEREAARSVVPKWVANADLIAKHFLRGEDGFGGAAYIWPSREAAAKAHDAAWRAGVKARTGSEPDIRIFDLIMSLDNMAQSVTEFKIPGEAAET